VSDQREEKFEYRNSKSETTRITQKENPQREGAAVSDFPFGILNLFRISNFEFRIFVILRSLTLPARPRKEGEPSGQADVHFQAILFANAVVTDFINEREHEVNAHAAGIPFPQGLVKRLRGNRPRVEWFAVVFQANDQFVRETLH